MELFRHRPYGGPLNIRLLCCAVLCICLVVLSSLPGCGGDGVQEDGVAEQAGDKWSLWAGETRLRGANIYQRHVYPELDGEVFMGPGPLGPPVTRQDIDSLAAMGANYVQLSHPGLFSENYPYTLDEEVQENLDGLLEMIADAGMYAVIAFRTGPGRSEFTFLWDEEEAWFDESYINDSVWEDPQAQEAWTEMWRYTAERYRDVDAVAGYELMVEPNANDWLLDVWEPEEFYRLYSGTLYDWNQLFPRIVSSIREVDPDTPVLVGGAGYSSVEWLPYIEPCDDERTLYVVHQYEPYPYTHQDADDLVLTYPGEIDVDYDGLPEEIDAGWLDDLLEEVDAFKEEYGVPVAVTEFGVKRWEPGAALFIRDSMRLFEQRGMNHALWEWEPAWEPLNEEYDAFNFRHGSDPDNHSDVAGSELMQVIEEFWDRNANTVEASNSR